MPNLSFTLRVEIGIAILVGDHLAAGGEADERAEIPAGVFLELGAIAPMEVVRDGIARRRACRATRPSRCGSRGRNRACRPSVPDRATRANTDGAAGAVFVVRRQVFQHRHLSAQMLAPTVSMMYLPTRPLELATHLEFSRMRTVSHAPAARMTALPLTRLSLPVVLVDEQNAPGFAVLADDHFACVGIGNDVEIPVARAGGR